MPELDFLQSWRDEAAKHAEQLAVAQAQTAAAQSRYKALTTLNTEMTQLRAAMAAELKSLLSDIEVARTTRDDLVTQINQRTNDLADLLDEIERTVNARNSILKRR